MQCIRLGVGTIAAAQAIPYAFSHGQVNDSYAGSSSLTHRSWFSLGSIANRLRDDYLMVSMK